MPRTLTHREDVSSPFAGVLQDFMTLKTEQSQRGKLPANSSLGWIRRGPLVKLETCFAVNWATWSHRIVVAIVLKRMDDPPRKRLATSVASMRNSLSLWPVRRSAKAFEVGVGEESASLIQTLLIGQTAFDR